jgi:hypothetical protein
LFAPQRPDGCDPQAKSSPTTAGARILTGGERRALCSEKRTTAARPAMRVAGTDMWAPYVRADQEAFQRMAAQEIATVRSTILPAWRRQSCVDLGWWWGPRPGCTGKRDKTRVREGHESRPARRPAPPVHSAPPWRHPRPSTAPCKRHRARMSACLPACHPPPVISSASSSMLRSLCRPLAARRKRSTTHDEILSREN